jgi:hypothetical protein
MEMGRRALSIHALAEDVLFSAAQTRENARRYRDLLATRREGDVVI